MQLFAKINGAKKEKEDLVEEKGVGSSNESDLSEQLGQWGFIPTNYLAEPLILFQSIG